MKFYLFLDESGDHGMKIIDPNFPVLVLCGVLISSDNYKALKLKIDRLKTDLWGHDGIVFHSREIRRKEGDFSLFLQREKLVYFLAEFNRIIGESTFRIISAVIKKDLYKNRPGNPLIGAYGHALTFIIERCVFCLDELNGKWDPDLYIIAESRGADVDLVIEKHLATTKADPRGTGFVPNWRINNYGFHLNFMTKEKNNIGLQVADLMAYPIARYITQGYVKSQPFTILEPRLYSDPDGNFKGYGLKVFPE